MTYHGHEHNRYHILNEADRGRFGRPVILNMMGTTIGVMRPRFSLPRPSESETMGRVLKSGDHRAYGSTFNMAKPIYGR